MSETRTIRLRDGRVLAYSEWGPSDGAPVFGFHGTPNSRLVHLGPDAPDLAGVRLILPDRPGLGRSDFQPGRTLLDWPRDLVDLADALGLERFAVFGVSGGGPHAAACGYALPERVSAVGLVSAAGPAYDVPEVASSMLPAWRELTHLARIDFHAAETRARRDCTADLDLLSSDPDRWLGDWEITVPSADRTIVAESGVRQMYIESCREASVEGYVRDLLILVGLPWKFRVEDIGVPVHLWHGAEDTVVPVQVARWVAEHLSSCDARILPAEGHLLVHPRAGEILQTLATSLDH